MEYLTSDELSKLWGISPRQVRKYCMEGLLDGAFKDGSTWKIPSDVKRPKDGRVKSGKYFDWRMKYGRKVERENV